MATYTFRTSDLPKLDLDTDKGTDFLAWHQQWIAYCSLSGLSKESATKQVQAVSNSVSREKPSTLWITSAWLPPRKREFPNQKSSLPQQLKVFWSIRDNLSVDDDLIVYGCRLFIPDSLRATMLSRLHDAHQGISRSQARARLTIYWPGIDRDIENFVQGCRHCQDHLPSNAKEPMINKPIPDRPFQQIAADFGSYGVLIVVDCKTDWPDIIDMGKDTTAPNLIAALRDQLSRTWSALVGWRSPVYILKARQLSHCLGSIPHVFITSLPTK